MKIFNNLPFSLSDNLIFKGPVGLQNLVKNAPLDYINAAIADAQNDIANYNAEGDTQSAANVQARIDYVNELLAQK